MEKQNLNGIPLEILMSEGWDYYNGNQRATNLEKALEYFECAADNGNPMAQYMTGHMYLEGEGDLPDFFKAQYWLKLAADQDIPDAAFELARIYRSDIFTTIDKGLADEYQKKVGALGYKGPLDAVKNQREARDREYKLDPGHDHSIDDMVAFINSLEKR